MSLILPTVDIIDLLYQSIPDYAFISIFYPIMVGAKDVWMIYPFSIKERTTRLIYSLDMKIWNCALFTPYLIIESTSLLNTYQIGGLVLFMIGISKGCLDGMDHIMHFCEYEHYGWFLYMLSLHADQCRGLYN